MQTPEKIKRGLLLATTVVGLKKLKETTAMDT